MAEALVEVGIRLGAVLVEVGVGLWDDQKRKEKKEARAITTADPETGRAQPPAGSVMAGYFIKEGARLGFLIFLTATSFRVTTSPPPPRN
jgi:hypothetical protein